MAKLAKAHRTNTDKVVQFMTAHPMNQLFVIEAISRYAKDCAKNEVSLVKSMKNSMVSGEAWVASAKAWNQFDESA